MKQILPFLLFFMTAALPISFSQEDGTKADFYATDKIQDIEITFDVENWSYVLDSLRFNGNGYLEATVMVNGETFKGAGVQYRGTKSFTLGGTRNPFNISLDYTQKDQHLQGYKTLKLSNALRDPSMVREVLGYEIARTYMPAPKANYARLKINDDFYGVMVNIESVQDPAFRNRYFESADNPFFKVNQLLPKDEIPGCKRNIYGSLEHDNLEACYDNNFEALSSHSPSMLMDLTKTLNENTEEIESVLNVDETLWMLAFNNILVNLSSYTGQHSVNYYLYQDNDGKFTPVVWDMNLAFGSFKNIGTGSDISTRKLFSLDPLLHEDNPAKPLISKLLSVGKYRKLYLSHLRKILYDYFANDKYEERAKELQRLIRIDMINDPNKFYEIDEFDDSLDKVIGKKSKIPGIVWLMSKRTDYLKKYPALAVFPPEISNVEVATREPLSNKRVENFKISVTVAKFPKRVWLVYRLGDSGKFNQVSMTDAGSSTFEITVTPFNGEKKIEYYIVAENAGLFSYSPDNYMWEHHHTTLEELNK